MQGAGLPRSGNGMFPGEKGFVLVMCEIGLIPMPGAASRSLYHFREGELLLVDSRDAFALPMGALEEVEL